MKFRSGLKSSNLIEVINSEMKANPSYWNKHYSGNENEIHLALNFSYSDRIRYYWSNSTISKLVKQLIRNLNEVKIPESLLSQFLPVQYQEIRDGKIENNSKSFIISKISEVLSIYHSVTGGIGEE